MLTPAPKKLPLAERFRKGEEFKIDLPILVSMSLCFTPRYKEGSIPLPIKKFVDLDNFPCTAIYLNFLSFFEKKIDFLYLDSLDGQFKKASEHQLDEIKIAKNKLHKNSLVLLDDKGSKTNLSIDYMLNNNFRILNETKEQVLLSF